MPGPINKLFPGCSHVIGVVLTGKLVTCSISFQCHLELGSLRILGPSLAGSPWRTNVNVFLNFFLMF